jgi:uncharacterized damage-inducible protein DinB
MSRPLDSEYGSFYKGYADAATGASLEEVLQVHPSFIRDRILELPEEKSNYRYAADKWTIKELLQHMIDTERVFSYRALRISRNDQTPLAGFDENYFAANAPVAHRKLEDLVKEFLLLREATDLMIRSFQEHQLNYIGNASNTKISLKALCFIIYGHNLHHLKILKERYL